MFQQNELFYSLQTYINRVDRNGVSEPVVSLAKDKLLKAIWHHISRHEFLSDKHPMNKLWLDAREQLGIPNEEHSKYRFDNEWQLYLLCEEFWNRSGKMFDRRGNFTNTGAKIAESIRILSRALGYSVAGSAFFRFLTKDTMFNSRAKRTIVLEFDPYKDYYLLRPLKSKGLLPETRPIDDSVIDGIVVRGFSKSFTNNLLNARVGFSKEEQFDLRAYYMCCGTELFSADGYRTAKELIEPANEVEDIIYNNQFNVSIDEVTGAMFHMWEQEASKADASEVASGSVKKMSLS